MLILVLVLKDSLRTFFKSLSWSLGVRSLSLSWSLGVRSLSLSLGGQAQEVLVLVLFLGGQVLVLVLGGQVLVNIPASCLFAAMGPHICEEVSQRRIQVGVPESDS